MRARGKQGDTMALVPFALLTSDTAWIARHDATPSPKGDGRVIVMLAESDCPRYRFAGVDMLHHFFADAPSDALNPNIACPVSFVAGL
jgi:hypothetical protein